MGSSIDIRVEDEYSAERKEQTQAEERKTHPLENTSQDNILLLIQALKILQKKVHLPILKAQVIQKNIYLSMKIYLKILFRQWMNLKQS